jgi:hypothetical protein
MEVHEMSKSQTSKLEATQNLYVYLVLNADYCSEADARS